MRWKHIFQSFCVVVLVIVLLGWSKTITLNVFNGTQFNLWIPRGRVEVNFKDCEGKVYINGLPANRIEINNFSKVSISFQTKDNLGCKAVVKWHLGSLVWRVLLGSASLMGFFILWYRSLHTKAV